MASVTNRTASSALNGQNVIVTLNGADSLSLLPTLAVGAQCTLSSSSKVGYVSEVDTYGTSFKIKPNNEAAKLDSSSTPGELAVSETITIV